MPRADSPAPQNLGLFLLYPKTVWRPRSVVLDAGGCDPVMPLPKVVLMGNPMHSQLSTADTRALA
jgi:hypothetical protein